MNNGKKIFILALFVAILVMAVGYAGLTQQLDVTGTANIDATWDIVISSITENNLVNASTVSTTINEDSLSATFEVNLDEPGASAAYAINIDNKGSIDAVLSSIDGITEANSTAPTDIVFSISGNQVGDDLLVNGDGHSFIITVTWDSDSSTIPDVLSKVATITFNYSQKV